jgi:hypothetical protein
LITQEDIAEEGKESLTKSKRWVDLVETDLKVEEEG